ncbi:flagellar hook capping FlgD N-terminal domain-containing protein [Pseudoruegeria sp. HB172150]|uniref:flagellar hook capping FlgD N-terminal domain-containing protein n=1 Tax=Pseudoruegeria sp. HB172150 TaxID=2721164 RepID=UPI0015580B27|nr:flagellar hook capping FlgD N-terminal domain-containing protein [Pseudoruegeria sp. HB172150]
MELAAATAPGASPSAVPASAADSKATISSDFETFLRMLTVQIENQDPLNPIKAEEFAVQLATFAGVEQQVRTNQLLETLSSEMGLSGIARYADWIGKEARAPVSAYFNGDPVTVIPEPLAESEKAVLVVQSADGTVVQRLDIPVTDDPLVWDGTTAGGMLEEGLYSFSVESRTGDSLDAIKRADVYARVTEAKLVDGETVLVMDGGEEALVETITALRPTGPDMAN